MADFQADKIKIDNFVQKLNSVISNETIFIGIVLFLYTLAIIFNLSHHEMWRDELNPWVTARDNTYIDFIKICMHDPHMYLWPTCLFILTRITHDPAIQQILNAVIVVSMIYIFLRFSPFTRLQKALFAFGYFPLYEYGTITREYSLELLLLFAFCVILRSNLSRKFLFLFIILALLMQLNIYSIMIALLLGLYTIYLFITKQKQLKLSGLDKIKLSSGIIFILTGLGISIAQFSQVIDDKYNPDIWLNIPISVERFTKALYAIWTGYIPIPKFVYHFWETSFLDDGLLKIILSLTILALSIVFFLRKKEIFILYGTGILGILSFMYLTSPGFIRHKGQIFIFFIVCLWIMLADNKDEIKQGSAIFINRIRNIFLVVIFTSQIAAGMYASWMDFKYPFSESRNAAEFIKKNRLEKANKIGFVDYAVAPINAYVDGYMYFPQGGRVGTYVIFDKYRLMHPSEPIPWQLMRGDTLFILNTKPKEFQGKFNKIAKFNNSIVGDEDYYLFLKSGNDGYYNPKNR